MENEQAIQEELNELRSRLAGLPKLQPFRLPAADYLLTLPDILTESALQNEMTEPDWGQDLPFETPAGYFEGLTASLMQGLPGPNERPELPAFETPAGYFDKLPQQLLAGIKSSETGTPVRERKTVAFRPAWRKLSPWIAAAAILSGVWIGVDRGYDGRAADNRAMKALAVLDRDSLDSYVELHADDFDPETLESALAGTQATDFGKAVSELQSDEIEDYLNDAGPGAQPVKGS